MIRITADFRIIGKDLNPTMITSQLSIIPDEYHSAGDPNIGKSGRIFSPFREGFWSIKSLASSDKSINTHIESILERLKGREANLINLSEQGYYFDIFFGIFEIESNYEIFVDFNIMKKLAELKINIDFDLYSNF